MDIVLMVFIDAPSHVIASPKEGRRWTNGDISRVINAAEVGTRDGDSYTPLDTIGMTRQGFIFVIDLEPVDVNEFNNVMSAIDSVTRRDWTLNLNRLFIAERDRLETEKHITITGAVFEPLVRHKQDPALRFSDMGVRVDG